MATIQKIKLKKSQLVEKIFYLNGNPLSLKDYRHMRPIYDMGSSKMVMQFGRQTTKSSTMANIMLANSIIKAGFHSMYVSPTVDQTKVFSNDRLAPLIESSPFVKKRYINSKLEQNVFRKKLLNQSTMYLRYALLSADRLRGYSNDMILYDEAQDLIKEIVPIANQSMSRSIYKHIMFAGTPKRTIGTLAFYWGKSTKNEWMPKCSHCNKYNYLDEKNIGKLGLICRHCGKRMDPNDGLWIRTGAKDAEYQGFRVSQLQFCGAPWVDWKNDIIIPMEDYGTAQFYNEVLGIAHDEGVAPITEAEVRACCTGGPMTSVPTGADYGNRHTLGLDYGPVNSNASFTLLSVLHKMPGKTDVIKVRYLKKYDGKEADFSFIHKDVPKQFNKWKALIAGTDYGLGEASNSELRSRLGDDKIIAYQHLGTQKDRIRWNPRMRAYTLSRNTTMTQFFNKIKKKKIIFPRWEDFKPFAKDILSVAIDYDEEKGKMTYINSEPDDALHSILYGALALELVEGMSDEY